MFTIITPKKALSTTFYKLPVLQSEIEKLSVNFDIYIKSGKENESEEYHKGLIRDFLASTWYSPDYAVNTNGREDLVIFNGTGTEAKPAVIIEAKSPTNTAEMFNERNLNCKALQECVYYFLKESIIFRNKELKHIIISDYNDFYIFDAKDFSRFFLAKTNPIVDLFKKFELGLLSDKKTSYFYENCAKPAIAKWIENETFTITHFSTKDFIEKKDNCLIPLYKILSPEHLLNKPFANDSNSLDKNFYAELLHIIGLEEKKVGSKKLIRRKAEKDRNKASLLESAIYQLEDRILDEQRLFETALRLVITWINRLLFLKLVESQQIAYQQGDANYHFLTIEKVDSFDELNILFFKVLGRKVEDRDNEIREKYKYVPYLNSSLFEESEDEHFLLIHGIQNKPLALYKQTVLKNERGRRLIGEMDNLSYIFKFLDAYNFSSEGSGGITQESKTLINASVLGLIFEKINGYKDGSFFTPGFITEYMAKETIQKAVIQKFNDEKGWKCNSLDDVANEIEDKAEANKIINSIKICDPSVGSGHFLVSVLNRLLYIKSYLNILVDKDGKRIKNSDWELRLENDEISVLDGEGNPFIYNANNSERRRVQETLFNEKLTLIENCLFGVDINPASVYICRLRLWIELLKNTYYTAESGYTQLETLPNIDINIKCGNSLVSRIPVNVGHSIYKDVDNEVKTAAFRKRVKDYRDAVVEYKNENNKENKRRVEHLIKSIKSKIRNEVQLDLFDEEWNKEAEESGIFSNSLEWMLEFPEVLDDEGKFVGFDVVIGNPPYGIFNKRQNQKVSLTAVDNSMELIRNRYPEVDEGMINAARVFYAHGFHLLSKEGYLCMIIPFGILGDTSSVKIRKKIFNNHSFLRIDAFPERDSTNRRVFEDAKMSTAILLSSNKKQECNVSVGVSFEKEIPNVHAAFSLSDIIAFSPEMMQIPMCNRETFDLLIKIRTRSDLLKFGDVAPCLTGELDMTLGEEFLTHDALKTMLVKGVQIARYIFKTKNEEISQGQIEYVETEKFFKNCSFEKQEQIKHERIVMQGLTGINEPQRLKATFVPANLILANSANFLKYQTEYPQMLLLALFNSKLLNFIFKATSTSSNVNGYEVNALPLPRLIEENAENRASVIAMADKILAAKKADPTTDTEALEKQIDLLIYKLYGLSYDEVLVVEPEIGITKEDYEKQ